MSEKYIAGFIDADGYISVRCRVGARPDLEVSIAQRNDFLDPLYEAQGLFGGTIRHRENMGSHELQLRSGPARKCIERIKKHLVVKKHQAQAYLVMVDTGAVLKTSQDVAGLREQVKAVKRASVDPKQNHPTKKWMAGYIDGDGSFSAKVCKKTGYAYPTLSVLGAENYTAGIRLLHKAFGGRICMVGKNHLWQVQLSQPSKAKQVIGYCLKHLQKKQDVARFIYECAKGGNFRDGEAIRNTIKALNSQQHRLSDSTVKDHINLIDFSIQKKQMGRPIGIIETSPRRKRQSKLQVV
jgi:hypothetical protein